MPLLPLTLSQIESKSYSFEKHLKMYDLLCYSSLQNCALFGGIADVGLQSCFVTWQLCDHLFSVSFPQLLPQ